MRCQVPSIDPRWIPLLVLTRGLCLGMRVLLIRLLRLDGVDDNLSVMLPLASLSLQLGLQLSLSLLLLEC